MTVDLDDLRASHDDDGAHSHLYATMVKIAGKTADGTVRREAKRRKARHRRLGVAALDTPQARGVGGYTKVATRRWLRRKTSRIRRRRNAVVGAAVLPVAVARTSYRAVRGTVRLTTAVVRAPVTLLVLLLTTAVVLLLVPLAFPSTRGGLGGVIPGSTCGQPAMRPAGGLEAVAYGAGTLRARLDEGVSPVAVRDGILAAARKAGELVAIAQAGAAGGPPPMEQVPPPVVDPRQGVSATVPAAGVVVPAAAPSGTGSVDEVADAVVAAGERGEDAALLVAITYPESGRAAVSGGPVVPQREARNPASSARGYWQIMVSVHPVTEGQAFDPLYAARFAVRLRDESPAGLAGPWAQTYGEGLHEPYLADARAAVARAEGRAAGTVAQVCAPDLGAPGGAMQASLSNDGLTNGALPEAMLAPLSFAPGQRARPAAAQAAAALSAAYAQQFGVPLPVTDSYRSRAGQEACTRAKGSLCAVPGTSQHGWGLALDLGGGVQRFGSAQHEWMRANAGQFGWYLPGWAHPRSEGGTKPEPWHWEHGAVAAQQAG